VLKEALQVLGYHAELASSGQEALARFAEHKGDIRLALLDLTMPDGSGDHVAEELRRASPDLPLVVMSGHSDTRPETPGVHFLPKPFSLDDLERVLGETLG
jgi:CheY-like chemotaxis protein